MEDRYLTPEDAASRLRIGVRRLRKLVREGKIAAAVLGPRTIRIREDALRDFAEQIEREGSLGREDGDESLEDDVDR